MIIYKQIVILIILQSSWGFPVSTNKNGTSKVTPTKILDFMRTYGYIEKNDGDSETLYTAEGISETVKLIQKHGAIPETGILDNATLALISSPRCGVPDIVRDKKRTKRYVLSKSGWNKRTISYYLANWSPKLGEASVAKSIQLALDTWAKYGNLKFHRTQSPDADIIIAFGRGYHGDNFPFDGSGGILAHAYFPYEYSSYGGDAHFDEDEDWIDRRFRKDKDDYGTDFFTVALHELGHSLGLAHSLSPNAVMFPYYHDYDPEAPVQLDYDDILGIYELYIRRPIKDDKSPSFDNNDNKDTGFDDDEDESFSSTTTTTVLPTTSTETTTIRGKNWNETVVYEGDDETVDVHKEHDDKHSIPPTNSPSLPNICDGKFDAVATLRQELFFFKDQYIWRLKDRSIVEPGYPILLQQMFPKLPNDIKTIDAVYERPDSMIVLFTGRQFWVYNGNDFIENSPRPLTDYGLPSYLDRIDAVQIWGKNQKTYFYRRDRFWRYNETTKTMDRGYPRHMEVWRGVPENLDAATTWKDGVTYFFKDELYWTFDNNWVIVTEQSPLPSPQVWLGCPEDERSMRRLRQFYYN